MQRHDIQDCDHLYDGEWIRCTDFWCDDSFPEWRSGRGDLHGLSWRNGERWWRVSIAAEDYLWFGSSKQTIPYQVRNHPEGDRICSMQVGPMSLLQEWWRWSVCGPDLCRWQLMRGTTGSTGEDMSPGKREGTGAHRGKWTIRLSLVWDKVQWRQKQGMDWSTPHDEEVGEDFRWGGWQETKVQNSRNARSGANEGTWRRGEDR